MNIKEKLDTINQIIIDAKDLKNALQDECEHPLYTAKYGGDSGNWCSSDDSYWVDLHCPDCDWRMRAYSDCPETKGYYQANHERTIK